MEEVLAYLKEARTFFVATCEKDQPRVRPFGAVTEFEGKLYITTGNGKEVFKQMMDNDKVEISAMGTDGTWIRLQAKVVRDERKAPKVKMLEDYPNLKGRYNVDDGIFEVLYLKEATAKICSFTAEPKVIQF